MATSLMLRIIGAAACFAIMATEANALEPLRPGPHRTPYVPTPEECAKFPLTPEEYVDRLHALVMHGDLRDVAFVEKALHVKFDPRRIIQLNNAGGSDYFVDPKSSPYSVDLAVPNGDAPTNRGNKAAKIWLRVPAFKNCKHLTRAIVASRFPGPYSPVEAGVPHVNLESTTVHVNGKNIKFVYQYDDNNYISNYASPPTLTQTDAQSVESQHSNH